MNPGMLKLPIRRKAVFTPERKPHKFPIFMFVCFFLTRSKPIGLLTPCGKIKRCPRCVLTREHRSPAASCKPTCNKKKKQ